MTNIRLRLLITAAPVLAGLLLGCASGDEPPDPPVGLKAAAGNRSVTLSWTADKSVDYYTLYYGTKAGVTDQDNKVKRVTSPYLHQPLDNGVTVYYRLRAANSNGFSALSEEVSASPVLNATAPGAPASVTATPGDGKVTLTWGAVSGAAKYIIYRDTNTGVLPGSGTVLDNVTSPHEDTSVTNGNSYYYVITATIQQTEGLPSAEVYATPQAGSTTVKPPASLTATAGNGQVTLSWPAVTGASGYTLYWGAATGVQKTSGTAITGASSGHVHSGLANGSTYYYVVTATVGGVESAESTEASATPQASAVSAPAVLSAAAGNGQVTLSWSTVTGASSYTLYWSTTKGVTQKSGTAIAGVTNGHVHSGLSNGATYYYVVTATAGGVQSADSPEANATPKASGTKPGAPASLVAVAGVKKVTLTWPAVTGASSYTLYWSTTKGVSQKSGTAITTVTSPRAHTGLTAGTTYYYVVTASNTHGQSADSPEASAKPQAGSTAPGAPTGLKAVAGDKKITLSWSPVSGATSYTLYWGFAATVSKKTGTSLGMVTSPYTHTPLSNGTTYHYVVTASNTGGESVASKAASATPQGSAMGTVISSLTGGAYAVVLLENTYANQGIIQLMVYTADPTGTPAGTGISGLTVLGSGAASGKLAATKTAGVYQGQTSSKLTSGTYVFKVSGATSGTVSANIFKLPTCTITTPTSGASFYKGQDLTLKWTSTNSQKAQITLKDNYGTVVYNPLKPDPQGAIVPGKDIPYPGILSALVSAAWSVKATANNAGIIALGDGYVQVLLK